MAGSVATASLIGLAGGFSRSQPINCQPRARAVASAMAVARRLVVQAEIRPAREAKLAFLGADRAVADNVSGWFGNLPSLARRVGVRTGSGQSCPVVLEDLNFFLESVDLGLRRGHHVFQFLKLIVVHTEKPICHSPWHGGNPSQETAWIRDALHMHEVRIQ